MNVKMETNGFKSGPQPHNLPFTTLDVFTSTPYEGNPLALIRIPASLSPTLTQEQKQLIAREFNLSETIFLHQQANPSIPEWKVDIFTTDAELPFAGHPTIGAANYVLGLSGEKRWERGVLVTKAGRIRISLNEDGRGVKAEIPHNVHIHKHTIGDLERPIAGLSKEKELRKAELRARIVSIVKGMTFLLVELENLEMLGRVKLEGLQVDFHGVLDKEDGWGESFVAKYYFVVLKGEEGVNGINGGGGEVVRVRTRMLELGMEDPATGSAASALASWLALREGRGNRFEITQGVEMGRKSVISVDVALDGTGRKVEGVRLSGSAVVVMEGSLRI
jgi:PhzF family phenazine biosynthesis protein